MNVCLRPILLKKSALVATAKKLASEIEILKVGRGLRAEISRSDERKRRFHRSRLGLFGQSDFFNRIDPKRPVASDRNRPIAGHGHAVASLVMCTQAMSLYLPAFCRVFGATLKPNKELRMDKERYQAQVAQSIRPVVLSTYS